MINVSENHVPTLFITFYVHMYSISEFVWSKKTIILKAQNLRGCMYEYKRDPYLWFGWHIWLYHVSIDIPLILDVTSGRQSEVDHLGLREGRVSDSDHLTDTAIARRGT